jgi:rhodanese-related sulfurtransferase
MSNLPRLNDPRVPKQGDVHPAERMFRVNWISAEFRSPSGIPLLSADYVSRLGRAARIVDLRTPEELIGPLGFIPGSDWVPEEGAFERLSPLDNDDPIVLVSRGGERAGKLAAALEAQGKRFVAELFGGILDWRANGLSTIRDREILDRRNELRETPTHWGATPKSLDRAALEAHVGDPRALRWRKLAALLVNGRLSCVDGRDDSGVMGTPGGDSGEFLLALGALERITRRPIDEPTLRTLLLRRLDAFGRFYFHTDVAAGDALIASMRTDHRLDAALATVYEALEWRRFMSSPPEDVREIVLEHAIIPDHIGCGHLRLALQNPDRYGIRPALIQSFLREFMRLQWSGHDENETAVLPGGHAEGAVVNIVVADGIEAFSAIPLVSPTASGSQMFVNHPQVAGFLRAQLGRFLTRQYDVCNLSIGRERELIASIESLGETQLGHTLANLAAGLPVFEIRFDPDHTAHVSELGHVPSAAAP